MIAKCYRVREKERVKERSHTYDASHHGRFKMKAGWHALADLLGCWPGRRASGSFHDSHRQGHHRVHELVGLREDLQFQITKLPSRKAPSPPLTLPERVTIYQSTAVKWDVIVFLAHVVLAARRWKRGMMSRNVIATRIPPPRTCPDILATLNN